MRFLLAMLVLMATAALVQAAATQPAASAPTTTLAELPHWPIGLHVGEEFISPKLAANPRRRADILVWVPPGATRLRAVLLCPNNSDSKVFHEHEPLRQVAAKYEAAIVFMRVFSTGIEYHHAKPLETPPAAPENMLKLLDLLAKQTGIAEFRHAPWITFGKSSRGEFPFRMGWLYPQRTIAGITYHGESPTWPIPKYAKPQDQNILYVCANGQEEWSGTWYRHVRPNLLNYHAHTAWLTHQVVGAGVGHGNYDDVHGSKGWGQPVPEGAMSVLRIWDYLTLFVDRALQLRLPEKGYPTEGPLALRPVDAEKGYLVHPRAVEELLGSKWMAFRKKDGAYQEIPWPDEKHPVLDTEQGTVDAGLLIRKASDVPPTQRKELFWVPDRQMAQAWLKLHNVKSRDIPIP
jgi:hypothetical protein